MAANRDPGSLNERAGPEIVVRHQGTTTAIEVHGERDLAGSPSIRQTISRAMEDLPECIVLDVSQVEFMDSTGLHAAIELTKRSAAQNTRLVIIPGPEPIQRMFEITALLETLPFIEKPSSGSRVARPHRAQNGAAEFGAFPPPTRGAGRPPQAAGVAPSSAPPAEKALAHAPSDRPPRRLDAGTDHDKLHCPRPRRASRITTRRPVTSH
jgi:anti-sigma B factor antagonist